MMRKLTVEMVERLAVRVVEVIVDALDPGGCARSTTDAVHDDYLAKLRARVASAPGTDAAKLKAFYAADVGLLLDEVDRLRYKADQTSRL